MSTEQNPSAFGPTEIVTLSKQGVWLSNGEEITHAKTLQAFSQNLFRVGDKAEVRIGPEKKEVVIEDTFYYVQSMEGTPHSGFTLLLNDGRKLKLDPATLRYQPGRLTCKVAHPPQSTFEDAKFLSAPYYELLNFAEKLPNGYLIDIEKISVALAPLDSPNEHKSV